MSTSPAKWEHPSNHRADSERHTGTLSVEKALQEAFGKGITWLPDFFFFLLLLNDLSYSGLIEPLDMTFV